MQKRFLITLIMLIVLLLSGMVSIGQDAAGSFRFVNEVNVQIDEDAIRAAAQELITNYQADVAIYLLATGNHENLLLRLSSDGLGGNYSTEERTVSIYVAIEQPYSVIRVGAAFDRLNVERLRTNNLNPMLREGNYTQAFINTLHAATAQMSNPFAGIGKLLGPVLGQPFVWAIALFLGFTYLLNRFAFGRNTSID